MTCVIGIRQESGALIAFDSFSGGNGSITVPRSDLKGGKLAPWLAVGYTWSYRYGQIMTHHMKVEKPTGDELRWMIRQFVPAQREALKEHGWLKKADEREEAGQSIVAVGSRVFVVHSDFSVQEPEYGFVSVGSGVNVALGALHVLKEETARTKARKALEAAAIYTDGVRPPWHMLTTRLVEHIPQVPGAPSSPTADAVPLAVPQEVA